MHESSPLHTDPSSRTKSRRRSTRVAAAITIGALLGAAQIPLATAALADDAPIAGGLSAGDSLFPNQGNSGYDALHYDIALSVDVAVSSTNNAAATTTFSAATATILAQTTGAPLSSYAFDFQGSTSTLANATLNVNSVTVNGQPATFSRIENTTVNNATTDSHKLIVTPSVPVSGEFTTVVNYSGRPVAHTDTDGSSEGWNATTDGATFVNQPIGSMTAFPNNNTPRDKATYTFSLDIPTKLTTSAQSVASNPGLKDAAAVSNGELISRTPSADGSRTTWLWNQAKPMASELSLISIGRYDMYTSTIALASGRSIPEWTFIDPAIAQSSQNTTLTTRAQMKDILDYLESKFGPYPGNSTGLVTDVVPGSINYALETQDRSFFPTSAGRSTTIHEIMHQWWGDNVSPVDWNDIWLNEGPATYSENLVAYESVGSSTTTNENSYFTSWNNSNASNAMWTVPTAGMTQASQLFGSQVYTRGSWTLEALRTAIGSADFNTVMYEWQHRYGGTSKRTSDFIALAEEISGRSLTAFFQPWLYGTTKAPWPAKFNLSLSAPTAPVNPGDTATFTLSSRNTGKVVQNSSVVTVDVTGILDKAVLGTLPSGLVLTDNTLTWTVPSTAVGATSTASFTAVPNSGTAGATLSATARASTLGSTCVSCSPSIVIGSEPVSPSAVPTISGTATVGQELTAVTDGWAAGTTFAYQWLADGTPIAGATASTYTPDGATAGLTISVRVTGSNGSLSPVTTVSAATSAVVRRVQSPPVPTISGTPQFGKRLTAESTGWDPGTYLTYQWATVNNGVSTNVAAGNGGTGPTFVPTLANQLGTTVTVTVTGNKFGTTAVSKTSAPTAAITGGEFVSTPTPSINGTGRALSALGAVPGQWDDGTTLTYAWSANDAPINGATASTYTPTIAQIGASITVTVTGTKPGFPTTSKTSAPVTVTQAAQVLQPTPTITGTAEVDSQLTLVPGTWDAGTAQTYQWLADDEPLDGVTGTTFTPDTTLVGSFITVEVTSTRENYVTVTKTTAATAAVAEGDLTLTPVPTIAGTPKFGVELEATVGEWDSGTSLAYQWFADATPIADATDLTFTPGVAEVGTEITFSATATKTGYATTTKTSEPTAEVAAGDLEATPVPTISGTPKVGVTLTATPGDWDAGTDLAYQWSADGQVIDGAIAAEYTPGASRLGATLTVAVTGTKPGYTPVTKTSDPTAAVAAGSLSATPLPTIVGTPKVGVLLTALPGTWDADTTLTYQWYAGDQPIASATSPEFTPDAAQFGAVLTVAVTGTKVGYEPVTKTSEASAAVAAGDLTASPVPTITGTPKVDSTLTAVPGTWDSGTVLSYQWYAGGQPIASATAATFTPSAAQLDAAITVAVTGTKTGYTPITRTSEATTVVVLATIAITPTPTITGVVRVGSAIVAVPGSWTSNTALAYQWFAGADPIAGATSASYTPTASHLGDILTVTVTGTKAGYAPVTKRSAATRQVAAGIITSSIPTFSGTVKVGVPVTAVPGTWDPSAQLAYRWYANGTLISSATGPSYTPDVAKAGQTLTVSVTGTRVGYTTITKTSGGVAVTPASLTKTPVPTTAGAFKVGTVVTAVPGTWDTGTTFTYQWKRNGVSISGATAKTYQLKAADRGALVTVTVTGKKTGYSPVSMTTAGTIVIR